MVIIDKQSFLNPPDEFTPIPFWFWNDELNEEELLRQIRDFNEKGVKGFVIHPRIGIPKSIGYLSNRFMELVSFAVREAKELGMIVILYDEAMYPSGSAHGMVVQSNPEYASKGLKLTEYKCSGEFGLNLEKVEGNPVLVQAVRKISDNEIVTESITKLTITDNTVSFDAGVEEGWYVLVFTECFTRGHIRGIHFGEDDGEEEAPPSADLLNPAATREFIRLTHERYYEVLKAYFGTTVTGFFTDEPDIMGRGHEKDLIPWTGGFMEYIQKAGLSETDIPLLWFEDRDRASLTRKKFTEAVNRKMEEAYYRPLYEWCDQHGIALTGHPGASDDIGFLKYFHMPAQDVVWRWVAPEDGLAIRGEHSTMAKCSSDSARHRGKRRNGNECFACCGKNKIEWSFTAEDMKWYMDWLFVRGVNLLYPHAFFYSIDGPRRWGERPPDVGPNNIWWPYYKQISDYIKRMCWVMTDSINQARVSILCEAHRLPWEITEPLYENQIEFNYLEDEIFISDDCKIEATCLKVRNQSYQLLVLDSIEMINNKNMNKIQCFIEQGGKVLIFNPDKKPLFHKALLPVDSLKDLAVVIRQHITPVMIFTEPQKDLRITHVLKDNSDFLLLVNEGDEEIKSNLCLSLVGAVESWDAVKGCITEISVRHRAGERHMIIPIRLTSREALLMRVDTRQTPKGIAIEAADSDVTQTAERENYLDKGWQMGVTTESMTDLENFTLWNETEWGKNYSGTNVYRNHFLIKKGYQAESIQLDLGKVYEIAEVTVNGRKAGVKLWAPYTFDVTELIIEGDNEVIIEVHNTIANKMCNLNLDSGLMGPIKLIVKS